MTEKLRKAAEQALEAFDGGSWEQLRAAEELRVALEELESHLKKRQKLTDDEIRRRKPIAADFMSFRAGIRSIEIELGIGTAK